MFQLWKLVLLCGLLAGTSASLLGDLSKDLKDVIEKGREAFADRVDMVREKLKDDLDKLRDSKAGQLSGQALQKAEDLLAGAVSKVISSGGNILGLKVSNVHLMGIKAKPTPDGKGLNLTFPVTADVELSLPLIGKTAELKASLDLLSGVRIETEDGKSKVVLTKCVSDPATVSLTLLDSQSKLANRLADAATSFLSETLSILVQNSVCPLVRLFVSTVSVDFVQDAIDNLQKGNQTDLPA